MVQAQLPIRPGITLLELGEPQATFFAIDFLLPDLALVGTDGGLPGLRRSTMSPKDRDARACTLLDLDWGRVGGSGG